MARSNYRGVTTRRSPKELNRRVKKKPCALCRDRIDWVDYKDVPLLRKYMSDRGKIRSRRVTGNCAQHQRALAQAIKTARELVLLPYTQRTVTEKPGGRGGRGDRGDRGDRTLAATHGRGVPPGGDRSELGGEASGSVAEVPPAEPPEDGGAAGEAAEPVSDAADLSEVEASEAAPAAAVAGADDAEAGV
jgi:small subunit ribosomal protein S18